LLLGRSYEGEDWEAARACYAEVTESTPKQFEGWFSLGRACLAMANYEAAMAAFGRAERLEPNNPRVLHAQALGLRGLGRLANAMDVLDRALALDPYDPNLLATRGELLACRGEDALALAAENQQRLIAGNVHLRRSDLFQDLRGEVYDLIVTNPPYVTHDETDALPAEYAHEPELGLRAGDDGLDLALKILRDAPAHLSAHGLLICEVGEAERALVDLLPELPLAWVEFKVGQMGIFVAERSDLVAHHATIKALADARG